jgi:hypothetical protein
MPINMDEARLAHFASTIHCQTGSLPFTYLGLPLGITKPTLEHFLPMVCRVEKRLCGIANFLDYGGKLLMVKSVQYSLPIFFMCCLDIPISVKEQLIKYMRHCLWRKKSGDVQSNGPALVAWEKICRPKNQGGLGVLDLTVQNKALLLKNLHKFFNRQDIPWVNLVWSSYYNNDSLPGNHSGGSFWWKSHLKLIDQYKCMGKCVLGDGKSAHFWTNMWHDDVCLHQKFHRLVTFAKNTELSIHLVIHTEYLEDLFHLPFSQQAFQEFEQLENLCEVALQRVQEGDFDKWKYIWGNFSFTSRKAYKVLIGYQPTIPHFTWIWKTSCQARHKFFFWLLILDRLNTRILLKRKNFHLQNYSCEFPGCNEEETLEHLF